MVFNITLKVVCQLYFGRYFVLVKECSKKTTDHHGNTDKLGVGFYRIQVHFASASCVAIVTCFSVLFILFSLKFICKRNRTNTQNISYSFVYIICRHEAIYFIVNLTTNDTLMLLIWVMAIVGDKKMEFCFPLNTYFCMLMKQQRNIDNQPDINFHMPRQY